MADLQIAADKLRIAAGEKEHRAEPKAGPSATMTLAAIYSRARKSLRGAYRSRKGGHAGAPRLRGTAAPSQGAPPRRRCQGGHGRRRVWSCYRAGRCAVARCREPLDRERTDTRGAGRSDSVRGGAGKSAHIARARALWELDRCHESIAAWTLALRDDPEDADAFLGRARCFARLGRWDPALADLESAVNWSFDRPQVLAQSALVYVSCLAERPNRLSRVFGLALRGSRMCSRLN